MEHPRNVSVRFDTRRVVQGQKDQITPNIYQYFKLPSIATSYPAFSISYTATPTSGHRRPPKLQCLLPLLKQLFPFQYFTIFPFSIKLLPPREKNPPTSTSPFTFFTCFGNLELIPPNMLLVKAQKG